MTSTVATQKQDLDLLARLQDCRVIVSEKLNRMRTDGDLQTADGYEWAFNILIRKINEIETRLSIQPKTSLGPIWRETANSPI